MIESLLFLVFGVILIGATLLMVLTKNVIHGAYGLAVVLLCVAALFVLLNAEFLAVIQLFMYAGGVVVLLIFGIMITNRKTNGPPITSHVNVFIGSLVSLVFFLIIGKLLMESEIAWASKEITTDQVSQIGKLLMTDHLIAFELIALLLLAVLVGAALLAKKSNESA